MSSWLEITDREGKLAIARGVKGPCFSSSGFGSAASTQSGAVVFRTAGVSSAVEDETVEFWCKIGGDSNRNGPARSGENTPEPSIDCRFRLPRDGDLGGPPGGPPDVERQSVWRTAVKKCYAGFGARFRRMSGDAGDES